MTTRSGLVSAILVLSVVFAARTASAGDPNKVFAGQIIPMVKRPPSNAKSPDAYIGIMRKMKQTVFVEDKSDHSWTIWLACFLKAPLNDVEYSIKYYDTSHGQQFLASSDNFTDSAERGNKTILTKIKLDKKWAGVNHPVLITVENKGKVLASATVMIKGEGEAYSGKVNFSEDEAHGKDGDDDAKK
jgi:hypothetical protein